MYSLTAKFTEDNWSVYSEISISDSKSSERETNAIIDITRNPGTDNENNIVFDWRDNSRIPSITPDFAFEEYAGQIYRLGFTSVADIADEEVAAKIDFEIQLDGNYFTSFKTGAKYNERTFERSFYSTGNIAFQNTGIAENVLPASAEIPFPVDNFLSNESGDFPRSWAVFDPAILTDYFNIADFEEKNDGARYGKVQEDTLAVYVRADYELDTEYPVIGNIGLRYVSTDQASAGYTSSPVEIDSTARPGDPYFVFGDLILKEESTSYSELLWNINAKIDLNDEVNLRLAAARVMSRADISDLSPGFSYLSGPNRRITTGEPNLTPFLANQFDASLEWYFAETGALTFAAFYKDIETVVENTTTIVPMSCCGITENYEVTKPSNVPGGSLFGFEVGYQSIFDFLPAPFNKSGIQTNYTYAESDIGDSGGQVNHSLVGLSKHTANLSFFYEDETFGGRISYNYRDEFLTQTPNASGLSKFTDTFGQLDASISYTLNEHISFTIDAINLLDAETYEYIDVKQHSNRLSYTGRRFFVGTRVVF